MPARRIALSSAEIPISDLIYRFDASQVALNTTYANGATLPNHAGDTGFAFKSIVLNVPTPVVQNIMGNALFIKEGDGWDSYCRIESTAALSVATQATTIAFVVTNVAQFGYFVGLDYFPKAAFRKGTGGSSPSYLRHYGGDTIYTDTYTQQKELFLIEFPANNEVEPKTFKLYKNGAKVIELTDATDYSFTPKPCFAALIKENAPITSTGAYFHDVLYWRRKLTEQEKTDAMTNLMTKWGV
jgi:hypothetical protein